MDMMSELDEAVRLTAAKDFLNRRRKQIARHQTSCAEMIEVFDGAEISVGAAIGVANRVIPKVIGEGGSLTFDKDGWTLKRAEPDN